MGFTTFQGGMRREKQSLAALCIQPQTPRPDIQCSSGHLGPEGGQQGWPWVTSAQAGDSLVSPSLKPLFVTVPGGLQSCLFSRAVTHPLEMVRLSVIQPK